MFDFVSRTCAVQYVNMDLYHALNRGVDKRVIFTDSQDYARFVHNMYEFNTSLPAHNTHRSKMFDLRSRTSSPGADKLVHIHGWCLMNNHYHLLLGEQVEGGVVKFLRKLNVGYSKYFNERHKRSGTLFQGRTKKLLIDNDAYFLHILNYIHLNPLDQLETTHEWRSRTISDTSQALDHLKNYRWSSYLDYIEIHNFPSILTTSLFKEIFEEKYEDTIREYLKDIEITEIGHLTLD